MIIIIIILIIVIATKITTYKYIDVYSIENTYMYAILEENMRKDVKIY